MQAWFWKKISHNLSESCLNVVYLFYFSWLNKDSYYWRGLNEDIHIYIYIYIYIYTHVCLCVYVCVCVRVCDPIL